MTFANDRVLICPNCRNVYVQTTIGSGNTFGARIWSDGRMIASMYPTPPIIRRCDGCDRYFFLEDAREVGYVPMGTFMWEPFVIDTWDDLSAEDYRSAIEAGLAQPGTHREIALRTRYWWALNDRRRHNTEDTPTLGDGTFQTNLDALARALGAAIERGDFSNREEGLQLALQLAEALRELSRFDDALQLLLEIDDECGDDEFLDWIKERANKVRDKARQHDSDVFLLSRPTEPDTDEGGFLQPPPMGAAGVPSSEEEREEESDTTDGEHWDISDL